MLRTILILGLAAGWVAAGEAPLDAFLYEKDFVLEAGGDEPLLAVHEMEEAGYEVHLLFEFPVGLYRITEMGKLKEAIAGIMLEYNRRGSRGRRRCRAPRFRVSSLRESGFR